AQATDNSSLVVGLGGSANTATAGHKSGTATITFVSDGSGTSGLGQTALTGQSQIVNVSGDVYRLASPSAAAPNPVTIANQRVGGSNIQGLTINNTAVNDGFSEGLRASIGSPTGDAIASGATGIIGAGGSSSGVLNVAVNTSTAGHKIG